MVIQAGIPAISCFSLSFGASAGNSEAADKSWLHGSTANMQVVRSHIQRNLSTNDAVDTLPLYRSAPPLEVRLEDFELYALDRLRVLKGISDGLSRGKKPEEMDQLVIPHIYDHFTIRFSNHTGHYHGMSSMQVDNLWKAHMRHQQASELVNKDVISHFVLRLVYCRT